MDTPRGPAFFPIRLNTHSQNAWAVVNRATGAIALDADQRLMMRLSSEQARAQAERLSAGSDVPSET